MKDIVKGLIYCGLFIVPFLTLYVANEMFFPYITGKNFAFRIIVEVVLALWVILALFDKTYRPKFSWMLVSFTSLIAVMLLSTLQAEHVATALWSNFERMDGFITLIHVFLYFVVLGSMLQTPKAWSYFLHTSVAVAGFVALKGLSQLSGATVRVDSTLGNAAYMAIYMLFHIFFLAYLFVQTRVVPYRIVYVLLGILFVFVLLQTGTRGTAIGLATGALASVFYVALFAARNVQVRKYALIGVAALIVLFGSFYAVRDSTYIQSTPALARVANIDLGNDLRIRTIIWGMSVEGVQERPVFGWGNGNFNYVFNNQYDPRLYGQEQWFDRVHNIVFDWLIAGGVIGFLTYVSLFAAIMYYLVICAWRKDDTFTVIERGILFGLIVGYVTHNLVVFDNIVSYIFFATVLALLHSRYSTTIPKLEKYKIPDALTTQIFAPLAIVAMVFVIYMVNVPGIKAATGIIDAFRTQDIQQRLVIFKETLALDSFAHQEIVEQLAQQAMGIAQNGSQVDPAVRDEFLTVTETELLKLAANKPGDARLHVFLSSYYRATGNSDKAREQLALARSFSPKKQAIIIQQGAVELALGNYEGSRNFFKEAYELDTTNPEAGEYYFASLFYVNDRATADVILLDASEELRTRLAQSDFVFSALNQAKAYDLLAALYEERVAIVPDVAQSWASLAFTYYQLGQAKPVGSERQQFTDKAIDALARGAKAVPTFANTATCVTGNLKAGKAPELGCN
jgi:O-antigen ligase/tetratricopeptide (TPR) repeat protein